MTQPILQSGYSRVFLTKNRAAPFHAPIFEGLWRAGGVTWDQGRETSIYTPSPTQYGKYDAAGKIVGQPGLPQISMDAMYTTDLSDLLAMVAGGCEHDIQIHFGLCRNPSDFNGGWDKILVLEAARAGNYTSKELGALEPSQGATLIETTRFEGQNLYEIKRMSYSQRAKTQVAEEVVGLAFCDAPTCGLCGLSSDGCQVIIGVVKSSAGSPGLLASVVFSVDGGLTWATDAIDSMAAARDPSGLACIGVNTVVISASPTPALEYAATADIVNGVEAWAQVTTGFVTSKGPLAISSLGATATFIVGQGGYIYFTADPTSGVSVQDAGVLTTQDLLDVQALDFNNVLAVGNANTVVFTTNGGLTWSSVTGPAVGTNMTCCWMVSPTEWFVGTSAGRLFYTINAGSTWTEKLFPGSGSGVVRDIKFPSPTVGYLAHSTAAAKGRLLRTIDGGNSFYVTPEGTNVMPTNAYLSTIAICPNVNNVVAGGLQSGSAGIIVQGQ